MSSRSHSLSAAQAQAFDQMPLRPGQTLTDGRYGLLADNQVNKYHAAKILTLEGTRAHAQGLSRELEFLQQIAACEDVDSLPVLEDRFEEQGPGGTHLCFVMHVFSSDVCSFRRSSPHKALSPQIVKNVLARTLEGLTQLREFNTQVRSDNILDKRIEEQLTTHPAKVEAELEMDGEKYPVLRSQPIPHAYTWDATPCTAETMSFAIIDLTAYFLRALLRSDFGVKGCLTFELLTGHWLFAPEEGETWSLVDDHFAKMLEFAGERFSSTMLDRAELHSKYLDEQGNLLRIELIPGQSIEAALAAYKTVPDSEIAGAASFLRSCLRLDSYERASAAELELHLWVMTA
ncbi:hypothetical protein C8Q80DRAFT_1216033 [Daedaleopsis nitida]|nr:hypothetical protein C8Q80DRAFT_1216033 [Daedaleopsis nitida]